jgi:hypothetical protein
MNPRLRVFAGLALTALAFGLGLLTLVVVQDDSAPLSDLWLNGGLLLVDLPLILLSAANLRWAQIIYVGLFFFGLHHRIGELGGLFKADAGIGLAALVIVAVQIAATIVLIREVRAQRATAATGGVKAVSEA